MGNSHYIIWIDDDENRKEQAKTLEETIGYEVDFECVSGKDLLDDIRTIEGKYKDPTLFIIDHFLYRSEGPAIRFGSSVAEILREKWPEVPIIAITNAPEKIDDKKLSDYEEVIPGSDLSQKHSLIKSIMEGFIGFSSKRPGSIEEILDLLQPPDDEMTTIRAILPLILKTKFDDKSFLTNIYRWVRHKLVGQPGFLYDKRWTASYLGIKDDSFDKVADMFKDAIYKGIFADEEDLRWWNSRVTSILFSNVSDKREALPWKLGYKLPHLGKKDKNRCYSCKKGYPETLAYIDTDPERMEPMHLGCTRIHDKQEASQYYFDIMRVMVGNDGDD